MICTTLGAYDRRLMLYVLHVHQCVDSDHLFFNNDVMRRFAGVLILIMSLMFVPVNGRTDTNTSRTLVIADIYEASPINPLRTSSTISAALLDLIYDSLVTYTSEETLKPSLAKEWHVSPDGLTWTFKLNNNIRFHDGTNLTAFDIKATYEALLSLNQVFYKFGFLNVANIEVISEDKLQIHLKRYDSFFSFFLNLVHIAPAKFIARGVDSMPVIGSGPFRLQSFRPEHIELVANDTYFRGRPSLDRVIVDIFSNQRTCLTKLIAGDADMVLLTDLSDYDVFADIDELEARQAPLGFRYWMLFNVRHFILENKNVRRALASALVSSGIDGTYGRRLKKGNDLTDAIELLGKEGWRDTDNDFFLDKNDRRFKVRVLISGDDDVSKRIAQELSDRLEQMGIRVEYDVVPSYKELVAKGFMDKDYDIMLIFSNVRSGMPQQYLFWHSSQIDKGGNSGGYRNPEVDRLLDEIRYNLDPAARKQAEKDLALALYDDPPGVPLFVKQTSVLVNKKFTGFSSDPFEFFSSFRNVRIREGSD